MSPLRAFVHEHLGDHQVLSRPVTTGATRLIHVRDQCGARWFAKRLLTNRAWRAESQGYAHWGHLPEVPTPRAWCATRRCVLLPELRGRQPSGQSRRVLHTAGGVLCKLHDVPPPSDWVSDWRQLASSDTDRRLAHLRRASVVVDERLIRDHVDALVQLTDLPDVATHGDFQPHNWRWHRGALRTFDFDAAGARPAVYDLARLRYAACWGRPRLFAALLKGYGRPLADAERDALQCMLAWRALVGISFGIGHGRPEMVDHGHLVLGELAVTSPRTR